MQDLIIMTIETPTINFARRLSMNPPGQPLHRPAEHQEKKKKNLV
jgi:hypothetical protein